MCNYCSMQYAGEGTINDLCNIILLVLSQLLYILNSYAEKFEDLEFDYTLNVMNDVGWWHNTVCHMNVCHAWQTWVPYMSPLFIRSLVAVYSTLIIYSLSHVLKFVSAHLDSECPYDAARLTIKLDLWVMTCLGMFPMGVWSSLLVVSNLPRALPLL